MSEITIDTKVVEITGNKTIKYICDECNIGEMKPTGIALMINPPLYEHVCTFCTHKRNLKDIYPKQILEIKEHKLCCADGVTEMVDTGE